MNYKGLRLLDVDEYIKLSGKIGVPIYSPLLASEGNYGNSVGKAMEWINNPKAEKKWDCLYV